MADDDNKTEAPACTSTDDDEAPRFRGVRLLAVCEHCGHSLPLPGPLRRVPCPRCDETNSFTDAFWEELLDRLDWNPRSRHVAGEYELEVTTDEPPGALRQRAAEPPRWLVVPSLRRLYGAELETTEQPPSVVVDQSARPVMMSCPACSASLSITTESERTTTCEHCQTDIYLPDDLWRRLHPVNKAERWFVEYRGPSSVTRRRRQEEQGAQALRIATERQELQLRLERLLERRTALRGPLPRSFGFLVWALLLAALLTAAGWFAGGGEDPSLGIHARLLCPRLCDGCTGPYRDGQCTAPQGTHPVPGGRLTIVATTWAALSLLLALVGMVLARRRRRKKRRERQRWLAELEQQETEIEARLAELRRAD